MCEGEHFLSPRSVAAAASLCPRLLERAPKPGSGTRAQCLAALAAGLINANIAMAVEVACRKPAICFAGA